MGISMGIKKYKSENIRIMHCQIYDVVYFKKMQSCFSMHLLIGGSVGFKFWVAVLT